jgi:hypothetical protein
MPLIIDTYNVLHTVGVLPPELAGVDVPALVRLIDRSRYRTERIDLVCDGSPPDQPVPISGPGAGVKPVTGPPSTLTVPANVTIRYSGKGREADEVIAMLVRHSTSPRRLMVVSSDKAILKAARKRKCKTLSSEEFLQHLVTDAEVVPRTSGPVPKPAGSLSDHQVEAWLSVFGVDPQADGPRRDALEQSDGRPEPTPANSPPAKISGPIMPDELIREAEHLWRSEQSNAPPPISPDQSHRQ